MTRLLCLGYGYCARAFVLAERSGMFSVAATFRRSEQRGLLLADGVEPIAIADPAGFDGAVRRSDAILVSAAPDEQGDPFASRVAAAIGGEGVGKKILYLSTIGVYGDRGGGWVDEDVSPASGSERGRRRLAAEREWTAVGARSGAAAHVLRLPGIYGPGRSAIDSVRSGTARRIFKPGQVFNRIHVEDIAQAVAALIVYRGNRRVWNVVDDEPSPPQDVILHAARLLGVPPPPEEPFATAALSPMAASFYAESKRVSNRALIEELGVRLRYPTYREGLAAIQSK